MKTKEKILEFLEKNSLEELIKKFPSIIDVYYSEKPDRLVIKFLNKIEDISTLGIDFKLETIIEEEVEHNKSDSVKEWEKRNKTAGLSKGYVEAMTEAISPLSTSNNTEAFEKWKKRNKITGKKV